MLVRPSTSSLVLRAWIYDGASCLWIQGDKLQRQDGLGESLQGIPT